MVGVKDSTTVRRNIDIASQSQSEIFFITVLQITANLTAFSMSNARLQRCHI